MVVMLPVIAPRATEINVVTTLPLLLPNYQSHGKPYPLYIMHTTIFLNSFWKEKCKKIWYMALLQSDSLILYNFPKFTRVKALIELIGLSVLPHVLLADTVTQILPRPHSRHDDIIPHNLQAERSLLQSTQVMVSTLKKGSCKHC